MYGCICIGRKWFEEYKMTIPFIDLKSQYQSIAETIQNSIKTVLEHGQYIMGPEVSELEDKLANYVGTKYCVTVSSGTDALLISMMALGIKPGDEVITTPFTFIATAEMISLLGATPVFVDIDENTYNIDPDCIERAITPRTRAIIPVSLYGQCADFDKINLIAKKYSIPVIEDGAQSFGATYKGKYSLSLSEISVTSFFPSKPLGCYGDGGACFTNNHDLATNMRELRQHGQVKRYRHNQIGINGRLDTIQAAILLEKLKVFSGELVMRKKVADNYSQELCEEIVLPEIEPYNNSVFAQYTIRVNNRDLVVEELKKYGIPTAIHYPCPLHLQQAFSHMVKLPKAVNAEKASKFVLSLPMHPYLREQDQAKIINSINNVVYNLRDI